MSAYVPASEYQGGSMNDGIRSSTNAPEMTMNHRCSTATRHIEGVRDGAAARVAEKRPCTEVAIRPLSGTDGQVSLMPETELPSAIHQDISATGKSRNEIGGLGGLVDGQPFGGRGQHSDTGSLSEHRRESAACGHRGGWWNLSRQRLSGRTAVPRSQRPHLPRDHDRDRRAGDEQRAGQSFESGSNPSPAEERRDEEQRAWLQPVLIQERRLRHM